MNCEQKVVHLHELDNVVIALQNLPAGAILPGLSTTLIEDISRGHKIAITTIESGQNVLRYGQIIGVSSVKIRSGSHVHTHNLMMSEHDQDYAFGSDIHPLVPSTSSLQFMGYHRADGRIGTRNYLGILTSVNCSGSVARFIAEAAEKSSWLQKMTHVDGVVPIVHGSGCGMSRNHEDYTTLLRTLTGYAQHPNFAGILLLGLGCEMMQITDIMGTGRIRESATFRSMTIQQSGGTRRSIEKGLTNLKEMAKIADLARRAPADVSHLVVGLQCGGSDSYSGITANPALGYASDILVRHGGTSILSETPEIYGAEHLLTRRAVTPDVGQKLIDRVCWWGNYTRHNDGEMNNNPSPGNKRGGLTTILEKSLGAVAKGGTAQLSQVYKFAEIITQRGLVFMDSPGYDPCSVTGQIAAGANLIAFTTGRGSVSGFKPTPCIKLATNTEMFDSMSEDMDINCGDVITAGISLAHKGQQIFNLLLRVASGEETKSEALGFGNVEFVPWKMGAVM